MKKMNKTLRNILYGFLAWLIPFVSAFFFYSKEDGLVIDIFLFKTIMIVVGAIISAFLLVSYFKRIHANYLMEGIIVGITWFIINIILDILILIPISEMLLSNYFAEIGLRYLIMPVMSIMVGVALENK